MLLCLPLHYPIMSFVRALALTQVAQTLRRSILIKAMLWMGGPMVLISAIASGIGYQKSFSTLEVQAKQRLQDYVQERGQRESKVFELAQRNQADFKVTLLQQIKLERQQDPTAEFDALVYAWPDGTHRNLPPQNPLKNIDLTREPTLFIGRGVELTREFKQEILAFHRLNRHYGPAWRHVFTDFWIVRPPNTMNLFWYGQAWALEAPADLNIAQEEYGYIADISHNPKRQPKWTGLYFDVAVQQWMVSLVTPVDDAQGKHIASIGNDIVLTELMTRTRNQRFDDTSNIIFSKEGRLIVDPSRTEQIQKANGQLTIDQLQDAKLSQILEQARQMTQDTWVTESLDGENLLGITRLKGPDWYFVTLYPKQLIWQRAFASISPLLLLTFCAVGIEIVVLQWVFRSQVSNPLGKLVKATQQIADGQFQIQLQTQRQDEMGSLAQSFSQMACKLAGSFEQLSQQQATLETQVEERTKALSEALNDLQVTQAQLIHSEKMSGLGQMVAGIAHEINNPVSFIHGNITPARQYVEDLLSHVALCQQQTSNPTLLEHAKEIDLDYLAEDLPKIIASMTHGTERIRSIVVSLRNFSRLDEADQKWVDIHEGIESALLIVNHRLQLRVPKSSLVQIQVSKVYGDLPQVLCYPSQLNQVVMNLLTNSIDALEQRLTQAPAGWRPQISITTRALAQQLAISIQDNGPGMTAEVQASIFDPFFTTKAVGKGTGMGLSISQKIIVDHHQGCLDCDSTPGGGTCFTIRLPQQSARTKLA
jgi:two-component system, NtrC family, sensor kinase